MKKEIKKKQSLLPKKMSDSLDKISSKYEEMFEIRALIQSIPWVGATFDTTLAAEGTRLKRRKLEEFLVELKETMGKISEEKIDKEFLNSEEFYVLFLTILERIMKTYEREKIILFRNIFINSIKVQNADTYYKEGFINIVTNLSVLHVQILKYYFEREEIFKKERRNAPNSFTSQSAVMRKFNIKESQFEGFCNDLLRDGLLYDAGIGTWDYKRYHYRVTNYASDFLKFITVKETKK